MRPGMGKVRHSACPRCFSITTRFPWSVNSTRDMKFFISITPRPQGVSRHSSLVGSGSCRGRSQLLRRESRFKSGRQTNGRRPAPLRFIELVAMLHRVDQRFLDRQMDAENVRSLPTGPFRVGRAVLRAATCPLRKRCEWKCPSTRSERSCDMASEWQKKGVRHLFRALALGASFSCSA